jgi:hypothetical protein
MTDQELKDYIVEIARSVGGLRRESAERQKESAQRQKEFVDLHKLHEEVAKEQKETARQIKQVNKQLGELGNKFGGFAEGMALPSMEKILLRDLGMTQFSPRHKATLNGRTIEIDVLAYDPVLRKEAYIIEVKSRLDQAGIDRLLKTIAEAPQFIPAIRGLKLYGIIAAVDIPDNVRDKVLKEGLYLARISDGTFTMQVPRGFKPKAFYPGARAEAEGQKKNEALARRKGAKKGKGR